MKEENRNVAKNKLLSHPEPDLGSLHLLEQKQGEIPYQVRNDAMFYNGGFTLIELLVVVLIIGILASVALPQYQKAVEKSKAAQAFAIIRTVAAAQEAYYLGNGAYATDFDNLSVDIPWTGNTRWIAGSSPTNGVRSNEDWSVQIFHEASGDGITVGRLSGPYAGAGFMYLLDEVNYGFPTRTMLCMENNFVGSGSVVFGKDSGDYCKKIMKGTYVGSSRWRL